MGGICGIVGPGDKRVESADLLPMMRALAYRGPHAQAAWTGSSVALGQLLRYPAAGSSLGSRPWRHAQSGMVITADTRLDNRRELRSALGLDFSPGAAHGDSELILRAYLKWGRECAMRLLGDFAFAIWDPERRSVFCARDHLGMKPIYYHFAGSRFLFASSVAAVASAMSEKPRLNEGRIFDFLIEETEGLGPSETFVLGVLAVPPGSSLLCRDGRLSIAEYWDTGAIEPLVLKSDDEYHEAFREVLFRSVSRCLQASHPVASMLSGGVDSSVVVALAGALGQRNDGTTAGRLGLTVSQVSDSGAQDSETRCIRAVASCVGIDALCMNSEATVEYADRVRSWLERVEDPFDATMLQRYILYAAARDRGYPIVLDGVDGDMVASLPAGYPAFLAARGEWLTAFRETAGRWSNHYDRTVPFWRLLARSFWPVVGSYQKRYSRHLIGREADLARHLERAFIRPEFAERIEATDRYQRYWRTKAKGNLSIARDPLLQEAHEARVRAPYLTSAVERYERVAGAAGVEARHPLLDRELCEFCVSLPWNQLCRHGWSKYGLRRVAADFLPAEIAWRRDWGGLDWEYLARWIELQGGSFVAEIHENAAEVSQWVDWQAICDRIHGKTPLGDKQVWYLVLKLSVLRRWLNRNSLGETYNGKNWQT